jgi:hypothetical protein
MPASDFITQQDIPLTLQPYANALLTNASNLTNPNTTPYYGLGSYFQSTGQTPFAGFNPLQTQAAGSAAQLGASPLLGQAAGIASGAASQAGAGGSFTPWAGSNPYAMTNQQFTSGIASNYMSPYMDNVVEGQKQGAIMDYARSIPGMGANAARVGGLGGTRNALVQAEGERNLQNQLAQIQSQGLQSAFTQGANQFNADQGRSLQDMGQFANFAMQGNQLGETSRQFGSQQGLNSIWAQLQAANALSGIGNQQFNQQTGAIGIQNQLGSQIQNTENQYGQASYADYVAQMNNPMTQLNQMSNIINRIPTGTSQTVAPTDAGNDFFNTLGGLGGLLSIFRGS